LIAVLLCVVDVGRADAQTASSGAGAKPADETEKPAAYGMPADADPRDIVVTARRGEALVEPETELDEERIGLYGAFTIGELIRDLAPLIDGRDKPPALLVNGKRVGDSTGIEGFPPEALERLAILPPEAAARYGYPADRRVVNLVLKQHFASWALSPTLTLPTAGGRDAETLSVNRVAINGSTYWNAGVRLARARRLLRSERPLVSDEEDRYRSLFPSTHGIDFNAGMTHPIGNFSGSLSLGAGLSGSRGLLGRDGSRLLRDKQDSRSFNLSTTLGGMIGGFQTSLSANYARGWNENLFEDKAPALGRRSSSKSDSWNAQLFVNKTVATLPAGPLTSNMMIGGSRSILRSQNSEGPSIAFRRNQLTSQLSLGIPVTSRDTPFLGAVGNISVDLVGGVDIASDEKRRSRYTAGLNWSPVAALDLRASLSYSEMVLSAELLNAPRTETTMRIYDYLRQETAELIWISGGNPDLRSGSQRALSLRATLRPFGSQLATFTTDYQRQVGRGGIAPLPQLSSTTERIFADRIVRDADGRLVSIDVRPIPIERDLTSQLSSSATLFLAGKTRAEAADGAVRKARIWDNGQMTMSLTHNWQLQSELLIAPGLPVLDRLGGDGGQSRHTLSLQLNAGWPGLGANLNGNWQSAVHVRDATRPDGQGDFFYPATAQFNFGFFVEPQRLWPASNNKSWLSKLRVALDVQNLFNNYRRVKLPDGSIPAGYRRYEIDPLGRTIQISVQKQF
jgi:ferric enterobactin receptor